MLLRVAVLALLVVAAWDAPPASAGWRLHTETTASIAYNQGVTFDAALGNFYFDGVSSATDSGLYRANSRLAETAANTALIPATTEGYNHAGDLSFDPVRRRVLLPLECYYPAGAGNTCGVGAIAVADPVTLRFRYYVDLDSAQIKKAMWVEISPDGRWIWTSSATHLLAYRASEISHATAERQRARRLGGLAGEDLGSVLPSSGVTGAAFYEDALTRVPRLLLALNRGTYSEVISYAVGTGRKGQPVLLDRGRTAIRVPNSSLNDESEGLAVTGAGLSLNPLGGVLDWLMLPVITPSSIFTRILGYLPAPTPPRDGASVPPGQRLRSVLTHGLRLAVVCNQRCTSRVTATIGGRLARRLGLIHTNPTFKSYTIGISRWSAGKGRRIYALTFRSRVRTALRGLLRVKIAVTVRLSDVSSRRQVNYRVSVALT